MSDTPALEPQKVSEMPECVHGRYRSCEYCDTPEPQPLTPEEVASYRLLYNSGKSRHDAVERLLATIDTLQAEKAESDARLAAIPYCCRKGEHHAYKFNDKAISGGKQNG
jgi:hypothetical protein